MASVSDSSRSGCGRGSASVLWPGGRPRGERPAPARSSFGSQGRRHRTRRSLGIFPPAVDVHALGDRDHGSPPLRKVACRDTQTRLGRRPWATIEWMLDPLIRPRRSGRIGAMALFSSVLWQGRPMTENRVCVARWRETGGASARGRRRSRPSVDSAIVARHTEYGTFPIDQS